MMLAGMGESQNGAAEQNQNGDGAANHGMLDERMSETTNLISNDFQVEVSSHLPVIHLLNVGHSTAGLMS